MELKGLKDILERAKAINNRTEDKIDRLKSVLIEYEEFVESVPNFTGFRLSELINDIDHAKNKRINVSKKSLHTDFKRIKELAVFRINHMYSILKGKSDRP